ncbi:MAG: hypothetical protein ACRDQB_03890, partial [Thermocrispum sp.]
MLAALACGAVGCTSTESGEPPLAPPTQTGAAEASAVAQLTQRPAELPLAGIEPCELFGKAALRELK